MSLLCGVYFSLFLGCYVSAQGSEFTPKSLYQLPDSKEDCILLGCGSGLYKITSAGNPLPLWTEDKVLKIEKADAGWYLLTSKGIIFSENLRTFEARNDGLHFLTIKKYDGTNTTLDQQVAPLKDLCINPLKQNEMVTATKDCVYLSRDGGKSWKSIGSSNDSTVGMKAVAVATIKDETVVFMSHPIFGMAYYRADAAKPAWIDSTGGFEAMIGQGYPDEIADILPVVKQAPDGTLETEIYISQSFIPRIYQYNWNTKRGVKIYSGTEPADTIDGMIECNGTLLYSSPGKIAGIDLLTKKQASLGEQYTAWQSVLKKVPEPVYAAYIPAAASGLGQALSFCELWLLNPGKAIGTYMDRATDKKAVYIPAHQVSTDKGVERYRKLIKDNKLNCLVIDMKDDNGLIRYHTNDAFIKQKAKESRYALDLDDFTAKFKQDGVYLVARIVMFKDPNLAEYEGGKYAVWNRRTNAQWIGTRRITNSDGSTSYGIYDERWVDPYSPDVWEYNIAIAKELVRRGFDEIQFDYIRFPTDGLNMSEAQYRWQSPGMDKESALVSFLSYARENIDAPIGIDIYGANGWYRSGTRTGQDVELLAEYVDVICPMFYPNHFENSFLNYNPWSERPYRIYFYGTYRNTVIGRNSIIVRPWVQAFYMNTAYDRQFYDKNYVQREIYGVRDSVDRGYMYWNNAGNYAENLSPDVGDKAYPWTAPEASTSFRKPALGPKVYNYEDSVSVPRESETVAQRYDDVSILNTVLYQYGDFHGDFWKEEDSILTAEIPSEKSVVDSSLQKIRNAWKRLGGDL